MTRPGGFWGSVSAAQFPVPGNWTGWIRRRLPVLGIGSACRCRPRRRICCDHSAGASRYRPGRHAANPVPASAVSVSHAAARHIGDDLERTQSFDRNTSETIISSSAWVLWTNASIPLHTASGPLMMAPPSIWATWAFSPGESNRSRCLRSADGCDMGDHQRGRGRGDGRHVVRLGDPDPLISAPFGVLGQCSGLI